MRIVVFRPAHALGCPKYLYASCCEVVVHALGSVALRPSVRADIKPFLCYGLLGLLKITFDARQEVVIMIYTCRCSQIGLLNIFRRVALARALRPLLVTLDAGQRACACRTPWAFVFGFFDIAVCVSFQKSPSSGASRRPKEPRAAVVGKDILDVF